MYCKHCGKQIPDDAKFCPHCSKSLSDNSSSGLPVKKCPHCGKTVSLGTTFCPHCCKTIETRTKSYEEYNYNDSGSFGWAVLGFIIPIVGLILFLVWKNEKPRCAKMAGKGALVSVIISVVFYMTFACTIGAEACSMLKDNPYYNPYNYKY